MAMTWASNPGAVTEDSELTMCLMHGLLAGKGKLDLFQHALYYGHWVASGPRKIEDTVKCGLFIQSEHL